MKKASIIGKDGQSNDYTLTKLYTVSHEKLV